MNYFEEQPWVAQGKLTPNERLKYSSTNIEDVRDVLKKHHWECIFELNAPIHIVKRVKQLDVNMNEREFLNEFQKCYTLSEIYCPHENIDRRAEYGIKTGELA